VIMRVCSERCGENAVYRNMPALTQSFGHSSRTSIGDFSKFGPNIQRMAEQMAAKGLGTSKPKDHVLRYLLSTYKQSNDNCTKQLYVMRKFNGKIFGIKNSLKYIKLICAHCALNGTLFDYDVITLFTYLGTYSVSMSSLVVFPFSSLNMNSFWYSDKNWTDLCSSKKSE